MNERQTLKIPPVSIAQRRIGRAVAAVPEEEVVIAKEQGLPQYGYGVLQRGMLLACILVTLGMVGHIAAKAKLLDRPQLFDINRVAIQPGLYIRCAACDRGIYNVNNVYDAFWTVFSQEAVCYNCHAAGNLSIAVKCPGCNATYKPKTNIVSQASTTTFQLTRQCTLDAICPYCGKEYKKQETAVLTDE